MHEIRSPLFWDLHLHGVCGIDFMHADFDEMVFACECLGRKGVGYFAPTLLTAKPAMLLDACKRWGEFLERAASRGFLPRDAAIPVGLHLEGPFLNPDKAGAHPPRELKRPSAGLARKFVSAARGHVAIVTLAPELPGGTELIRTLKRMGIRVQIGHTNASSAEALAAAKAGATGVTHLFNAMNVHHRAPGVLIPLQKGLITAELITDGFHVDPAYLFWALAAAPDQIYGVSDGCSAIGCNSRHLTLGNLKLRRDGDVAVVAATRTLAGGATWLADHPAILARAGRRLGIRPNPSEILSLFYKHQTQIARNHDWIPRSYKTNSRAHFHRTTLKFLGVG